LDFSKKVKLIAALKKVVASHRIQAFTGKLYLFISPDKLSLAAKSNTMKPLAGSQPMDVKKRNLNYKTKQGVSIFYGVSTTRNPNWKPNETASSGYWDVIRLTLDGNKISTKYPVKSYNDFWKNKDYSQLKRSSKDEFYAQSEEKIITDKHGVKDWTKYLLAVDVLEEAKDEFINLKLDFKNVPVSFVKDFSNISKFKQQLADKYKTEKLKKETAQAAPQASWEEMANWFERRTSGHIALVQKYIQKILKLNLPEIDGALLALEMDHDTGKWQEPEYTPYVYTTWRYKNPEYIIPPEVAIKAHESTFHHIKTHKHHPEYWDAMVTKECVNPKNRDKPNNAPSIVDCLQCKGSGCRCGGRCQACRDHEAGLHANALVNATGMPLTYIGSLMADWLAMSEEKKTDVNDWIKNNVNIRWEFIPAQVNLMQKIVRLIGGDR